jgi:hypothetical protein
MSKLIRAREIYLPRRTEQALKLAADVLADDHTNADGLATRYLDECLERDYPGVFAVVAECAAAYGTVSKENQKRIEDWEQKSKPAK